MSWRLAYMTDTLVHSRVCHPQMDGKGGAEQEHIRAVAAQAFVSFVHVAAKPGATAAATAGAATSAVSGSTS
jgi:hypothetical protein